MATKLVMMMIDFTPVDFMSIEVYLAINTDFL